MIKNFKSIKQHLYVIAVLAILLFSSYNSQQIFGHNFAGDESASFLALMDQMNNEMNLINTNLMNNNQSLAQDHLNEIKKLYSETIKKEIAERNERIANEISSIINETSIAIVGQEKNNNQDLGESVKNFNDVIEETISVRIDQDALTNATVQALHFANLINSIDASYATAFGTKPMNMSAMNMPAMNMSHGNDSSMSHGDSNTMSSTMNMDHADSSSSMASMNKDTEHNSNTTEISIITNIASYQTAKGLTNVAIDLFNSTIKQNIPSNATETANTIESSLQQLKDIIESKASYDKVMGVIHGPIQTTILETFNLPLKTSK
jgi:hypothetical protein